MDQKIRCGGVYCEKCKKCICPPRLRKHYRDEFWMICEECQPTMLRVTYVPTKDSPKTDFVVEYQHIPNLIKLLEDEFKRKGHKKNGI
jgi:hypothetical protein